jgi:hypothetical protein
VIPQIRKLNLRSVWIDGRTARVGGVRPMLLRPGALELAYTLGMGRTETMQALRRGWRGEKMP